MPGSKIPAKFLTHLVDHKEKEENSCCQVTGLQRLMPGSKTSDKFGTHHVGQKEE